MRTKKVSIAEGKRDFTRLLREARTKRMPILIYNDREGACAGVLLSPEEYHRYTRIRGYFEAVRLSATLQGLETDAVTLARQARQDLDHRGRP
ncbi:MAG: type II toxin-antitoxin system Phd/YefM family antitoxin [Armatimonadetes bacterium]|nr:type II toxin-antitoxin system Phd/YefM family antitoxin [Armatimonadota bacterium]